MKKKSIVIFATAAAFLAACGESTTENITQQITQTGMDVVESVKDLPKCENDNEGEIAWVKGENSSRVCVDGKWFAMKDTLVVAGGKDTVVIAGDTVYMDGGDISCTTKELADGSGLKIICNGDSIGVVLNGVAGKDGAPGEQGLQGDKGDAGVGCSIAAQSDTTVTIKCGDKSMTMNIGAGGFSVDTLALDSEKVATPIASLEGYTQKGPFLKGSTVYLYELSDGRTLRQTNGNFMSYITSDDGRYRFNARNLVSQYAMVVVDGNYRNEVTGKKSERPIRLRAITDVTARSSANVNLLTNLEYERVYYLVTQKKMKVRNAKKQAQAEIFKAFHIDTTGFGKSSEDLDVFGTSDADAALLAISIILQGDRDETDLMVLLTEISDDLATDGKWDDSTTLAEITDWTLEMDLRWKLADYRSNVKGWGLSTTVPDFEKYMRHFWNVEKIDKKCSDTNDGEIIEMPYRKAVMFVKCKNGVWNTHALTDSRDNQDYRIMKIGDQVWMAENLAYNDEMYSEQEKIQCETIRTRSGCQYTWAAAMDSAGIYSTGGKGCGYKENCLPTYPARGICPEGWHLPDSTEWEQLYAAESGSGYFVADDYGFSASVSSRFWSSTQPQGDAVWDHACTNVYGAHVDCYGVKINGISVRCIQDAL